MSDEDALVDPEWVIERQTTFSHQPAVWIMAAAGAAMWVCLSLAAAIFGNTSFVAMQISTLIPAFLMIGSLHRAVSLTRTPQRIAIGAYGVQIRRGSQTASYRWNQIGWSKYNPMVGAYLPTPELRIFDLNGKTLVTHGASVGNLEKLAKFVEQRIATKQIDTGTEIKRKKQRKEALLGIGVGPLMLVGAAFLAWDARNQQNNDRLLAENPIETQATVVRAYTAPNGRTRRLEYSFTARDGQSVAHNAEVLPQVWELFREQPQIPIVYAQDKPTVTRLALGEVNSGPDAMPAWQKYALILSTFAMGLFFTGWGTLQWIRNPPGRAA